MEYKLIRDVRFHDNDKQEFFFIKKGSVYPEVSWNNQTSSIKNTVKHCKKMSKSPNSQFVVLDTDGFQRVFEVNNSVMPHHKRRIRRIRRWTK